WRSKISFLDQSALRGDNRDNREDCNENEGGDPRDGQREPAIHRIHETRREERTKKDEEQNAHNSRQDGGPAFSLETQVGRDEEDAHENEEDHDKRIGDRRGGGREHRQRDTQDEKAQIDEA